MLHLPGERRRALALASLVTLAFYALADIISGIPHSPFAQNVGHLLAQPLWLQVALLAPVWLGVWLVALAQRQLIAQNEGAYGAALAISQVRGMRGPGLLLGFLVAALVLAGAILNVLAARVGILGIFASLYLLALGMPNAPTARYVFHPQRPLPYQGQVRYIPEDATPRALPPPPGRGTIIDAPRS